MHFDRIYETKASIAAEGGHMLVSYHSISKAGNREVNEDFVSCADVGNRFFFALADGLGGHGRGDQASRLAVEKSMEIFAAGETMDKRSLLSACFEQSQALLLGTQDKVRGDMKTTLVLLYLDGKTALWGHIGDSRLYHFRRGRLVLRTLDHSVPQMLVKMGTIREQDIRGHEDRNRLLKVVGTEWIGSSYEIPAAEQNLKRGDTFLLCSDGFWEWIDEENMTRLLTRSREPSVWLDEMKKAIQKNGAQARMDNYSAVAVFIR
jgi:serine/threonine protein phosphatase PrpC